jgi:aryl-alcohol dehydrogenase-like predicted oxidoreductase
MDILHPSAVIGTNSWGSAAYGIMVRGSYVEDDTIRDAMRSAEEYDLKIYDLARDYGFGKAQKMIGRFGTEDIYISAKYTPFSEYKAGCVWKSLEKDLADFRREYVDIYWLHPTDVEEHMKEIIALAKEGKIRHIGVSNFNIEECKQAKKLLEDAGMELYGVQNHYSIISREWEKNGLLDWCKETDISFWAWAVLEEGMLVDPRVKTKGSIMKLIFNRQKQKMRELCSCMIKIADSRKITVPQVAIAFCANKGIVPLCGWVKCKSNFQFAELTSGATKALQE